MKNYYTRNDWKIIEEGFRPEMHEASESIFSLGNGRMGHRANFEEKYSGKSLSGNYIAGVYYPDKTRVGWWKNGYPEYFAKVLNAPNWIGILVNIDGVELDLHTAKISNFRRELDMKEACLKRSFTAVLPNGKEIEVNTSRFLSIVNDELGLIRYSVKALNFDGNISFTPFIDGDIRNADANYDEQFWDIQASEARKGSAYLLAKTRKTNFLVCMSMEYEVYKNSKSLNPDPEVISTEKYLSNKINLEVKKNDTVGIFKYVSVLSSLNHSPEEIIPNGQKIAAAAKSKKYEAEFSEHKKAWEEKWLHSDIIIKGDEAAQQGIRFNIFHLNQTYTGRDERLNIGPKGFTGEKYGGSTYWDTEAFLIPFYLSTAPQEVARNLLIYRYKQLGKAIENAAKLGFNSGAALYPMVTMNGEECHNEWEITFEEIHRNGAIAFAVYNYIRYTGDSEYLAQYGLEVLIGISRFWKQRINWSDVKGKYVMLGVTGPNEYENNVNNNWYTNKMACWTLEYTVKAIEYVMENHPARYSEIVAATRFNHDSEILAWKDVIQNMYFPYSENLKVFLQQDGYLDKEQKMVSELDPAERPINQHWSWDRILRSCFLKQADVLQGVYTFEDEFDKDTIRRNFDFYEPRTLHESSLSPCVHSILANRIGYLDKAYELYLRTSRLDLDDYNNEVREGLHITSMGGTWMSVVYGFGGLRVADDMLHFDPVFPENWESLSFKIMFRENMLRININKDSIEIDNEKGPAITVMLKGKKLRITSREKVLA
ncbi:MAG: glycoside hydrolase family 65 protein [Bacteroidales bacterium]|nr:glycoside hydrolase family 65 protein [Bacteroidales bacterium]